MDSQGRSRLIIGGLSLAAVLLVISLLLTQQSGRLPTAVESPLASEDVVTAPAADVDGSAEAVIASKALDAQAVSPLAAAGPTSPLASPGSAINAALPVSHTATVTEKVNSSGSEALTATVSENLPVSAALVSAPVVSAEVTVTAQSTVTVTLAAPLPELYDYEVVATYPHDPNAFTQGLQYVDGVLYEGTGLYGQSTLRQVDLESGAVGQQISIPDQYFGEGITVLDDRIYQLTWKSRVAFVYDRESFEQINQFSYPTEGWGLTYDGEELLMSDGSAIIVRRDPETFAEVGRFTVHEHGAPVNLLNELEYIEGDLWANVWQSDDIVIIDPATGEVTGRVDFAGLLPADEAAGADVLNGIAYDDANDRIFVTGKFWPTLFEIEVVSR